MQNVFTIDADIKLKMLINEPTVVQNDAIRFVINVFDNGKPLDLSNVETVSLASVRLDRQTVVTPGTKIDENTVQFDLGTEETKFPGRVEATAQFYDSEGRVSTISFSYRVVKDPTGDGYIPSEREQTLIETVLNDGPLVIQQAQDAAAYATTQGNYAKQVANENKTRWLNPVATFADIATTYPNPQHGDTVQTTSDGKIYRYENGQWNWTQAYTDTALADAQNKIGILSEDVNNSFYKNNKILNQRGVRFIGHRGLSQLAPENTIPSFVAAGEVGLFGVETDIQITADGKFILLHDDTLDRTTNGTGSVTTMTLDQIRQYNIDDGANLLPNIRSNFSVLFPNLKVPTLEEYLEVCRKYELVPVMEAKLYQPSQRESFYAVLQQYSFTNDCIIISSDTNSLTHYRQLDKSIVLGLIGSVNDQNISFVKSLGNAFLDVDKTTCTQSDIEYCHDNGIKIGVWVVNFIREAHDFIKWGVDFITTDILIGA